MRVIKSSSAMLPLFIAFFLIVSFISLPFAVKESTADDISKLIVQEEDSVRELNECSLKIAIDTGMKEANNWSASVELVEASSADDGDSTVGIRGSNGLRYSWNLFFVDPKTSKHYYIKLLNNKVVLQREFQGYPYGPIELKNVEYNSNEALKIAMEYKNLKPGQQWAKGYHYELTQPNNVPILRVFGDSPEGSFSYVEINAKDGQVLSAKRKSYDSNGKASWENF